MNPLIEKARQRKAKIEQQRQQDDARDREYQEAREELERRTLEVSMPGYEGSDSHLQIKQDKDALNELQEEERNGLQSYRDQVGHEEQDDLLKSIRSNLKGDE